MKNKDKMSDKQSAVRQAGAGEPQTDLAEGELDTVEQSIRAHERKGELSTGKLPEKARKKEKR